MEQIIKQYLDELAEKDQLFKDKYKPEHLEWCIKYLYRQAEFFANKKHGKTCVALISDTVFHWAREYFDEGINIREEQERAAQKAREEASNKIIPEHDEDEDTSELDADINARIEESRRKAEEERIKREEKERYKREHMNGQITIFDILGG